MTNKMIKVLISENTPGEADELAGKLANADDVQVVGYARDGLEAAQMAVQLHPDVALIHTELTGMDGFEATQMATTAAPETACILLVPPGEDNEEMWRKAMRAGARGLTPADASPEKLLSTIKEVSSAKDYKDQREYQLITDPDKMPVTIAVTGAKGGIGKTTIATNLSVALQQKFRGQVVLVDFMGQYGDVPLMLDMQPRGGLGELLAYDELDEQIVQSQIAQHSCGLRILAAPQGRDMRHIGTQLDVSHIANLISVLRSSYRFVVFDAPPLVGDLSGYLFSRCTSIVVVTSLMDLSTIRDTGSLIESLTESRMPTERIKLVVNRHSQRNPFSIADLQQTVKHKIEARIPEDEATATASINEGIPLVLKSPRSSVAKAINSLCNSLLAELPKQTQVAATTNNEEDHSVARATEAALASN